MQSASYFSFIAIAVIGALSVLPGCAQLTGAKTVIDAAALARKHHFTVTEIEGSGYRHTLFVRNEAQSTTLWVFIEGDGTPWVASGREVSSDPTARDPLALRLAIRTRGSVLYLGRPCYMQSRLDSRCDDRAWTSARYSDAIVNSMNAALHAALVGVPSQKVLLVGYSGGGTLAALMARDNSTVAGVVTIAGNLDPVLWAQQHEYLPLTESRNPADEPPLSSSIAQFHLVGGRDTNVSEAMTERYLSRLSGSQVWRFEKFDHVCCWEKEWPAIEKKIRPRIESGIR
jgi:pimeloyl-ACP methyl ester carboxylesterase